MKTNKNIHVLPTDKPSRLYQLKNDILRLDYKIDRGEANKHIYITSDEEIKDKCYVLSESSIGALYLDGMINTALMLAKGQWKKVIITTDLQLIEEGVQAIDDEFLEWFVKNPSCEYVEVAKTNKLIDLYADKEEDKWEVKYHIYIPIEEPKQRLEKYSERFDNDKSPIGNPETWGKRMVEEPKQETLEEYIERETKGLIEHSLKAAAKAFIRYGAKWQMERSYSEEEVLDILNHHTSYLETFIYQYIDREDIEVNEEWLEQFKKK